MGIIKRLNRILKTNRGFRESVRSLHFEEMVQPIQTAFYAPNAISILESHILLKSVTITESESNTSGQKFSILRLSGLFAGKLSYGVICDTFLDYGRLLKPATEYNLENRIGYETEEEFQVNCLYLQERLSYIADTDDGIPFVCHRQWDNRYYLSNIDGAHHLAAVYRQCREQMRDFTFKCRIVRQTVDKDLCRNQLGDRKLLLFRSGASAQQLRHLLLEYNVYSNLHPEVQAGRSLLSIPLNGSHPARTRELYKIIVEELPRNSYFNLGNYALRLIK